MGLFHFFKKKESKNLISTDVPTVTTSINKIQEDIVPIEEKIRGKLPTCDSLYPHEILVLSYATKFMASENEFQKFWWYQYGIKDVQVILSKLELNNFIEIGSIADTVMNQKLNQLKQILKTHGLKVNGKKEDIAQRVLENISLEELNVLFPVKPYKLTQSGENLLKNMNGFLIYTNIILMGLIYGTLLKWFKPHLIQTIEIRFGVILIKLV